MAEFDSDFGFQNLDIDEESPSQDDLQITMLFITVHGIAIWTTAEEASNLIREMFDTN